MLSSNDVVLAIAEGYDGAIPGKTILQKVGYFVADCMNLNLDYRHHLYGPYSGLINSTVNELVNIGVFLENKIVSKENHGFNDHDNCYYSFQLTEDGKNAVKNHRSWHEEEFDLAVKLVRKIKNMSLANYQLVAISKSHFNQSNIKKFPEEYKDFFKKMGNKILF